MDKDAQYKFNELTNLVDLLDFYSSKSEDDLLHEKNLYASAEYTLYAAFDSAIGLTEGIVKMELGKEEKDHKVYIIRLGEIGIIDEDFAKIMSEKTEFWDRMMYKRSTVEHEETINFLKNDLNDFKKLVSALKEYLTHIS